MTISRVFWALTIMLVLGVLGFQLFPGINAYIGSILTANALLPADEQFTDINRGQITLIPFIIIGAIGLGFYVLYRRSQR